MNTRGTKKRNKSTLYFVTQNRNYDIGLDNDLFHNILA